MRNLLYHGEQLVSHSRVHDKLFKLREGLPSLYFLHLPDKQVQNMDLYVVQAQLFRLTGWDLTS